MELVHLITAISHEWIQKSQVALSSEEEAEASIYICFTALSFNKRKFLSNGTTILIFFASTCFRELVRFCIVILNASNTKIVVYYLWEKIVSENIQGFSVSRVYGQNL